METTASKLTMIITTTLRSPGLPSWFRHAYFEYHSHVRLRFKLAAGLGQSWTRDGGNPQGCPLSMMFIVALYLPWCRYLGAQLYADNLKCVSRDPGAFLRAASWPVLVQCLVCLMVRLVVIQPFVLFGSGFGCCVGTWPIGLRKFRRLTG